MKKILLTIMIAAGFTSALFPREFITEGKTYSALGDYRIELEDNTVTLNGDVYKAFVISYQNTPLEVKVIIRKERNCMKYIVLSDKLCVQYVCNKIYFGVERLDRVYEKDGYSTSDAYLNRNEYFHQKVITSGGASELDNTRLIASYFPMLILQKPALI